MKNKYWFPQFSIASILIVVYFQQTSFVDAHLRRAWPPNFFEASGLVLLTYLLVLGWKRPGSWLKTFLFFFLCAAGIWAAEHFGISVPHKDFLGLLIAIMGVHKALFSHPKRYKNFLLRLAAFVGFFFMILEAREMAYDWQLKKYGVESESRVLGYYKTTLGRYGTGLTSDHFHMLLQFKDQNGVLRTFAKKYISEKEMQTYQVGSSVPLIYSRKDPYTVSFEPGNIVVFDPRRVFWFSAWLSVMAGFVIAESIVRYGERICPLPYAGPVKDSKASYEIKARRMTDEERAELEKRCKNAWWRNIIGLSKWTSRKELEECRLLLKKDLEDGHVETLLLTTDKAVEFSWGSATLFFLEAGPSEVMFFSTESWSLKINDSNFPNTEIEFVRARQSRNILVLRCLGKPFKAEGAKEEDSEMLDFDILPVREGDIIHGTLHGLRLLFKKYSVVA